MPQDRWPLLKMVELDEERFTGQKIGPFNDPNSIIGQLGDIGHSALKALGVQPFGAEDPNQYQTADLSKISKDYKGPRFKTVMPTVAMMPLPPGEAKYLGPGSRFGKTLYREANLEELKRHIGIQTMDMSMDSLHLATAPEYALGQGKNTGVLLEFDAHPLKVYANTGKPGLQMLAERGEYPEVVAKLNHQHEYANALRSFTIKPGAQTDKVTRMQMKRMLPLMEKRGWIKQVLPDKSIK